MQAAERVVLHRMSCTRRRTLLRLRHRVLARTRCEGWNPTLLRGSGQGQRGPHLDPVGRSSSPPQCAGAAAALLQLLFSVRGRGRPSARSGCSGSTVSRSSPCPVRPARARRLAARGSPAGSRAQFRHFASVKTGTHQKALCAGHQIRGSEIKSARFGTAGMGAIGTFGRN